jgi:transmembrane sensor
MNIYQFPDPRDVTAEACEWLARLERGLTEEEGGDLREWLAANPKRAPALIEAAGLWDRMDSLSRLADLFPKPIQRERHVTPRTFALAAFVLVALTAALFAVFRYEVKPESEATVQVATTAQEQLIETAIGEHSTTRLLDGSELTLNTNSRVRAEFGENYRTLRLERGEIYVKVAHDSAKPLTVWAGDRLVRAVGTEFNVQITADQRVEVIVTDGKVLIGVLKANTTTPQSAWIEAFNTPLLAGQRVMLGDQESAVEDIGAKEIDVKLSWREGNLIFHGEPLADALGEIERYTRVTFVIRDEELRAVRVAGLFKAGDVDGLLATLRENFNISYERVGAQKIVLKNE